MNNPFEKDEFGAEQSDRTLILNMIAEINRLTDELDALENRVTELEREQFGKGSKEI